MDALHSISLVISLAAGAIGSIFVLLPGMLPLRIRISANRIALMLGVVALASALLSASVHLIAGHGSGSAEPMSAGDFIGLHKAYWIAAALCLVVFLGRKRQPRQRAKGKRNDP